MKEKFILADKPALSPRYGSCRGRLLLASSVLAIVAHGGELTAYSMVTHDGRRLVSRAENGREAFSLVPTNALPSDLPPVRPWKIYGVKSTHTDIGLHNSPYVQRHGSVRRIEEAMRLVDADTRHDDDPAAYRYVMEGGWFWENYPMDRGETAAWNVVSNYIRRGRIGVGCTCAGNHTHVYGPEEIVRSTLVRRRLVDKWGVDSRTMVMSDNPGISWSVVCPYAAAGIEHVLFSPNQWNPIPSTLRRRDDAKDGATWNPDAGGGGNYIDVRWDSERPMLFWWESPDRSARLLVWCSTMYDYGLSAFGVRPWGASAPMPEVERRTALQLKKMEARYPYEVWLAATYADDEQANGAYADFCAAWNRKWATPRFATVGNLDEPFDEVKQRWGRAIPTVRGEMTSGWLQHVVSAPELLAAKLDAERKLAEAERAWRADPQRDMSLKREIDRAWWGLVLNDEHSYGVSGYQGRRVFETWMQHRDWIECAAETAATVGRKYGLPAKESAEYVTPAPEMENPFYRIRVDERGEILSIFDKELGREILDGVANRFLYTRDNHKTWADESLLGAKITRTVRLPKNEKRIDIEDSFEHARDLYNTHRYYRYGYLSFPFAVPNGRFFAMLGGGEVIDPYKGQSGYATDAYVAVRDWCAVENDDFGVALRQWDSMLTEFGEIHPDKTCFTGVAPSGKSAIYSYLFTDWLQLHHPDGESMNFRFRYSVCSYPKGKRPWEAMPKRTLPALTATDFPEAAADGWTGLLMRPRASHGEKDGQLYLLWGADTSPLFSHYELFRDGKWIADVKNEAPSTIPYRVARYEDTKLGSHTNHTYRLRTVMKDGTKGEWSMPFAGLTRLEQDVEVIESEGLRCEISRKGGYVTSWIPLGGKEVLFRPKRARWGEEEVHGGVPICWPWFGKPPREELPKHGLARYAKWTLEEKIGKSAIRWSLESTPDTMKLWPHEFKLDYWVEATGIALKLRLKATNTGKSAFAAAGGFHPYFKVADSLKVAVDGTPIAKECHRVTEKSDGRPRVLEDLTNGKRIRLTAKGNGDWFDWNPGRMNTPLCGTLDADEWKGFFCVEPYSAVPYVLQPGDSHELELEMEIDHVRRFTDAIESE